MRRALVLALTMTAALGVGACGDDDAAQEETPPPIATVGEMTISADELERWSHYNWTRTEWGSQGAPFPQPPDFAECVADLREAKGKASRSPADPHGRDEGHHGDEGHGEEGDAHGEADEAHARPQRAPRTDAERRRECERRLLAVRQASLRQLISERWREGEAAERGWSIDDEDIAAEVDQQLAALFPSEGDRDVYLERTGLVESDLRRRAAVSVLDTRVTEALLEEASIADEAELRQYYERNQERFRHGVTRRLAMIPAPSKAEAQDILERVHAGASWSEIAADVLGEDGGAFTVFNGRLPEDDELARAVARADVGDVVGPIRADGGWTVFELLEVKPAGTAPFEEVRPQVITAVLSRSDQVELAEHTGEVMEKWKARTACVGDVRIPECGAGGDAPDAGEATP